MIVFLVVGGAIVSARLIASVFGRAAEVRRAATAAERRTIAEVEEGAEARVVGRIVGGEAFAAPFTGRSCVYLDLEIEEHTGHSAQPWAPIAQEVRGVPFTIDDGSGRALVDPTGASIAIDRDAGLRSAPLDTTRPDVIEVLRRLGVDERAQRRRLRYREAGLELGEPVAVVGVGVREPDPDAVADAAGYRDGPPTRLRFGGSARHPIVITDAPAATEVGVDLGDWAD